MGIVKIMNSLEQYKKEIAGNSGKLVVAVFTATWCPECKKVGPVLKQFAQQYDIVVVTTDVDVVPAAADMEKVNGLPFIKFYKNKILVGDVQVRDNPTPEQFQEKFTSIIKKNA